MAKPKTGYFRANQGFATVFDGENLFVQQGELVPAGHELLKGREEMFDPADNFGRFDMEERPEVEQATAAPGEKRGEKSSKK